MAFFEENFACYSLTVGNLKCLLILHMCYIDFFFCDLSLVSNSVQQSCTVSTIQ